MKLIVPLLLIVMLAISCSDGGQVGMKIEELMEKRKPKIEKLVLVNSGERMEFESGKIIFEGPFLKSGDTYYNLGKAKILRVEGTTLEVSF